MRRYFCLAWQTNFYHLGYLPSLIALQLYYMCRVLPQSTHCTLDVVLMCVSVNRRIGGLGLVLGLGLVNIRVFKPAPRRQWHLPIVSPSSAQSPSKTPESQAENHPMEQPLYQMLMSGDPMPHHAIPHSHSASHLAI